jgi:hypothetical protein
VDLGASHLQSEVTGPLKWTQIKDWEYKRGYNSIHVSKKLEKMIPLSRPLEGIKQRRVGEALKRTSVEEGQIKLSHLSTASTASSTNRWVAGLLVLSHVTADFFMEDSEEVTLRGAAYKPICWFCLQHFCYLAL